MIPVVASETAPPLFGDPPTTSTEGEELWDGNRPIRIFPNVFQVQEVSSKSSPHSHYISQ